MPSKFGSFDFVWRLIDEDNLKTQRIKLISFCIVY